MRKAFTILGSCLIIAMFIWNIYTVQVLISEKNYNIGFEQGFYIGVKQCSSRPQGDKRT